MKAVAVLDDDSVVVAGSVEGIWNGEPSLGGEDFAAVKLHSNGARLWHWQASPYHEISCSANNKTMIPRT